MAAHVTPFKSPAHQLVSFQITSFPESTKTAFEASHLGTIFFEVAPGEIDGGSLKNALTVPLWRAASSMSLMIPKADKTCVSSLSPSFARLPTRLTRLCLLQRPLKSDLGSRHLRAAT